MLSYTKSRLAGKTFLQTLFFLLLVTQICFAQGYWTKVGNMPEIRFAHTVNEINGKVYVVGGLNTETGTIPTTALVYDRTAGTWDSIPLLNNEGKVFHTSCVVEGKLYVIGGWTGNPNNFGKMEMFDPDSGYWTTKNPMPTPRGNLACASMGDKIYVIGGMSYSGYTGLKTLEVYDISTDTWNQFADMPTGRWGPSAVEFNGKIYVFGGTTGTATTVYASVEVYDPQTNTWITKSNIPTKRYQLTTCILDTNIYAIGGWLSSNTGPIYDKVEFYNPESDTWYIETPMPVARSLLASVVLDSKIYVYGGSRTNHPLIGTSAIYELSYDDIFALQPYIDKPYAKLNVDSVLFRTRFSNIYNHPFTPHLILANSDSTHLDSLTLYDDGLHGDSLNNDGLYGGYISPRQYEDFFILSVSTIDNQTNKYYNTPDRCRFTTAGPVELDSILINKVSDYYSVIPFVKNESTSTTITSASVKLICDDPWITSISPATRPLPIIPPGAIVSPSSGFTVRVDLTFTDHFNFKVEISSANWPYWVDSLEVVVSVEDKETLPSEFTLEQNFPNPFNSATEIQYSIPQRSNVTIKAYDILGNEVTTLVNAEKDQGVYTINFDANNLASGLYLYRIQAGSFIDTKKMILLK